MFKNIDKSNWESVLFGDVVSEVRNTVKKGEKENIDRYIGLEHIDPENIHISKWGFVKDGTTFTRKFEKEQILFGRRRAYLKKAGIATFTGLCSGDIIVMQAKEKLLPKLLPFLINNDNFFDFAVDTSAGSLSPRTKFKHLAEYKLLLPPKDQQAKIAELLWTMDDLIEKEKKILKSTSVLIEKFIELSIKGDLTKFEYDRVQKDGYIQSKLPKIPKQWSYVNASNFLFIQEGPGVRKTQFKDSGIKLINGSNILDGNLDLNKTSRFISLEEANSTYKHFLIDEGDLVIACSGIAVEKFNKKVAFVKKEDLPLCMNTSTMRFKSLNEKLNIKYFKLFLLSQIFKLQINRLITGSAQLNFGPSHMKKIILPLPPIEYQNEIVKSVEIFNNSLNSAENKINKSKLLQKSLINEIFSL